MRFERRRRGTGALETAMEKMTTTINDAGAVTVSAVKNGAAASIRRMSAALEFIADGMDELTSIGEHDLDGKAAYGFASIVRTCARELSEQLVSNDYELDSVKLGKKITKEGA
jgi:hypothetical protein